MPVLVLPAAAAAAVAVACVQPHCHFRLLCRLYHLILRHHAIVAEAEVEVKAVEQNQADTRRGWVQLLPQIRTGRWRR